MGDKEHKEKVNFAKQRSAIYGFLAAVYREEVNHDFLCQIQDPQFLGVLSDLGLNLDNSHGKVEDEVFLEDLAVEYAKLFLGPGKHISPHESVHHERNDDPQAGMLWGKSAVEVNHFVETLGLNYKKKYTGLPDHISVELELMQKLAHEESKAWKKGDEDGAQCCLRNQRRFLDEHLRHWVPKFCDKVIEAAQRPFYREMAYLTKNFIAFEKDELLSSPEANA